MYRRRPFTRIGSRPSGAVWQAVLVTVLIAASVLPSVKDYWYLDNGSGASDWRIGTSEATGISAHQPRTLADSRWLALFLVNRDRKLNGLSPLVEDPLLAKAAQQHAMDMLRRHFYGHNNPDGLNPTDRFSLVGGREGVGENITMQNQSYGITLNFRLVERFHKGWMYSKGHRENVLNTGYARFGYGIAVDSLSGRAYAVQKFTRAGNQTADNSL